MCSAQWIFHHWILTKLAEADDPMTVFSKFSFKSSFELHDFKDILERHLSAKEARGPFKERLNELQLLLRKPDFIHLLSQSHSFLQAVPELPNASIDNNIDDFEPHNNIPDAAVGDWRRG